MAVQYGDKRLFFSGNCGGLDIIIKYIKYIYYYERCDKFIDSFVTRAYRRVNINTARAKQALYLCRNTNGEQCQHFPDSIRELQRKLRN